MGILHLTLIHSGRGSVNSICRNICLWSVHKKKPIHTIPVSHGLAATLAPEKSSAETNPPQEPPCPPQPRYVTALATVPYSDLVLSGSWDGVIRVWKVTADKKRLEAVGIIGGEGSVRGVINGISVVERGDRKEPELVICAGTGKELRLGRWMEVEGRNGGYVMVVKKNALGGQTDVATVGEEDDA
jgi:ribosomal RNA-processing protein 9